MLSVVQTFWSVALLPAVSRVWTTLELSSPGSVGTGTGVTGGSESCGSVGRSTQVTVAATSTSTAIPGRRRPFTVATDIPANMKACRESRATTRNPVIVTGPRELYGDWMGSRCDLALMRAIGAPPQHLSRARDATTDCVGTDGASARRELVAPRALQRR